MTGWRCAADGEHVSWNSAVSAFIPAGERANDWARERVKDLRLGKL